MLVQLARSIQFYTLFILTIIVVPLSLLKDMTSLSWASSIGLITIVLIDIIIIQYAPSAAEVNANAIFTLPFFVC